MSEPITITHPKPAAQWHPTRNPGLIPEDVGAGSHQKPWWYHALCGYEWDAFVFNRSREIDVDACPACRGRVLFVGVSDFNTTHPVLAAQLHPTLNYGLQATDFTPSCKDEV